MRSHDDYIRSQIEADSAFEQEFNEARAELRLAMALTERREALELTQATVAGHMRISQSHIARYEKAGRTPLVTTLWRFCDALNATITLGPEYTVEVRPAAPVIAGRRVVMAGTGTATAGVRSQTVTREQRLVRHSTDHTTSPQSPGRHSAPTSQDPGPLALAA